MSIHDLFAVDGKYVGRSTTSLPYSSPSPCSSNTILPPDHTRHRRYRVRLKPEQAPQFGKIWGPSHKFEKSLLTTNGRENKNNLCVCHGLCQSKRCSRTCRGQEHIKVFITPDFYSSYRTGLEPVCHATPANLVLTFVFNPLGSLLPGVLKTKIIIKKST